MKDDEEGMVDGEDEVLKVMARHWEELGRKRKILKQRWKMWVGMSCEEVGGKWQGFI